MKTLKFKCTLLSDVILNQKAATEGPNQTLDFIPGSCFLGIVASELYPTDKDKANEDYAQRMSKTMKIFHSGNVRFGDAHPSKGDVRGLKIPASMFYPKLKPEGFKYYIHHEIPDDKLESEDFKKMQLKQCRNGFYSFAGNKATEVKTETNFAIKSAYDREKRRSKDEQMYGYESLQKGLELYFEVQVENDDLAKDIKGALVGKKHVGRSRTAQYGLVKIELLPTKDEQEYKDLETTQTITLLKDKDGKEVKCVTVYADGRLIFLDTYGLPTFRPTEEQLGLPKDSQILWDKSQIRTFQYAPWNYKRQCFDADRCGIEKGSVLVVKVPDSVNLNLKSQYIGSYNNEGFGKVIYNPEFLNAGENGVASCQVEKQDDTENKPTEDEETRVRRIKKEIADLKNSDVDICRYLADCKQDELEQQIIYKMVNEFVRDEQRGGLFTNKGEKFASQWGNIRSLSMQYDSFDRLSYELFGIRKDEKGKVVVDESNGYLTHGVAKEKWENKRIDVVKSFFDSIKKQDLEKRISEAMVNLAAEMAKEMSRKEDKQWNR